MRQLKFRLILNGKIVGWETHEKRNHGMVIFHQEVGHLGKHDICDNPISFIPHDSKDQWTGRVDVDVFDIYENDEVEFKNQQDASCSKFTDTVQRSRIGWYPFVAYPLCDEIEFKIISTPYK